MVGASGDFAAGSVRIEHTGTVENDEPLGLEVRWSEMKKAQTGEDLERRIKPVPDAAEKAGRKAKSETNTSQVTPYNDKRHSDREVVREFFWRSEGSGLGRIWRCSTCNRLVIAQVYGRAGSRYQERAKELLATVECHSTDLDWNRWALYGLDVQVPAEYRLTGQQLMNIYVELRFIKGIGKHGDTITVEQWSAANVQLKDEYLDEFISRKANAVQRTVASDKSETGVGGHPALKLEGERTGLGFWTGDALKQMASLQMPIRFYSGIAWECPESNKIYMVQALTAKPDANLSQSVADRTQCHAIGANEIK